ncbi:MAG: hypothetical protein NTY34_02030, partial [Candidatus Omnitrophica bacterium]|nr:hypothetical protein [Candidatus Omnitrophota bacterium]
FDLCIPLTLSGFHTKTGCLLLVYIVFLRKTICLQTADSLAGYSLAGLPSPLKGRGDFLIISSPPRGERIKVRGKLC